MIGKAGRLYICMVVCRLVGPHDGDSSDVSLACDDAQVIPSSLGRSQKIQMIQMIQMIPMTQMLQMIQMIQIIQMMQMIQMI